MPLRSPSRGGRVVWETEKTRPRSRSSAKRHTVVLPVPEGAETTKGIPRRDPPPLEGERNGIDYHFVSQDEFRELVESGAVKQA